MNVVFTQNSREQRRAAFHYAVKTIFSILVLAGSSLALAIPGTQVQSKYAGADAGDWGGKNGAVIGPADGTCANMGALDKVNLISNFNFDLPNDAIITDISAQIKAGSNGGQDVGVQLATNAAVDPPTTVGNQRNLSTLNVGSGNCAVTDITTIGGSLASWGNPAINPGNINTTQFGLVFSKLVTSEVKVDSVCLEISYTTVTGPASATSCFEEPVGNTITVTKVVEGVVPGSAWAFTGELGAFNIAAGGGFNSFQDLADDTYTITETTKAGYEVSRECHLDSDASVIVAEAASNTVNVPISGGQAITCVFTNTIVGDFTVYKDFTDDLPSSVGVTLSCTSGTITTNPLQASEASEAIFEVKGYAAGTTCTAVESVPGGYQGNISDCQDDDPINTDCTLVNSPVPPSTIAIFRIHKVWNQEGDTNDIPVNAFLSCTGANTTQIPVTFTATTDAILYVYDIGKAEGPVDCTITETVPANYTADYEVGVCAAAECLDSPTIAACKYIDVADEGNSLCVITNTPDPATIEVDKTWVIEGADQGFDGDYEIWLYCDSEVTGPGSEFSYYGTWYANYYANADDGHKNLTFTVVKPNYPYTGCYVYEENDDSVVETSNSCADDELELGAGGEASCDIVNTVFFEGIPTLNQYGMAILALLMLGVGFVGLRRFV